MLIGRKAERAAPVNPKMGAKFAASVPQELNTLLIRLATFCWF
jgi:hypothetical protein